MDQPTSDFVSYTQIAEKLVQMENTCFLINWEQNDQLIVVVEIMFT